MLLRYPTSTRQLTLQYICQHLNTELQFLSNILFSISLFPLASQYRKCSCIPMFSRTCNCKPEQICLGQSQMKCFSEHGEALAGPTESRNYLTSWLNTKFWLEVNDRLRRVKYADSARFEILTALLLNIQKWSSSLLGLPDPRMMALQSFETSATHVVDRLEHFSLWHCSCVRMSDRSTLWPVIDEFHLIHCAEVQLCLVSSR